MKKISVIVPCYNEEATIELFYEAITKIWDDNYILELVMVDDGSKDRTHELLKELSKRDERVHYTSFSRNFGKEAAMFCGLKQATGDAAVVIDADLQHPVSTIKEMAAKWEEGYDVIEGVKSSRGNESKGHGLMAKLFYSIISKIAGFDMRNSSDFKLIDRKVIDALNEFTEKDTFFRALTFWAGFKSTSVEYEVQERAAGESKWSGMGLIKYALKNIFSFTYAPLYLIAYLGVLMILITLGLGIDAIVSYAKGISVGGYPSLVILITLTAGAIMCSLGVIGIYIAKIYEEIKNRPRYISADRK